MPSSQSPLFLDTAMPTLRILSVYQERKRLLGRRTLPCPSRTKEYEVRHFTRYCQILEIMWREPRQADEQRLGKVPILSEEDLLAVRMGRALELKLIAARKKIRTSDCWFRELPGIFSVLESAGLTSRNVRAKCTEDGRLPVSAALWLLNILRTTRTNPEMQVGEKEPACRQNGGDG